MIEHDAVLPAAVEGSEAWPRIYPPRNGMMVFAFCSNVPFLAVGLFCVHVGLRGRAPVPAGMVLTGLLSIVLGIYTFAHTMCTRVILHQEAIEVVGPFGRRMLTLVEIAGRNMVRERRMNGARGPALVPHDPKVQALRLPRTVESDTVYEAWLAAIPEILPDPVVASPRRRTSRRSDTVSAD